MQKCIYCESEVSERGIFCSECTKQFRCKSCREFLEKDAKICIICGEEVVLKISSPTMNTIEFTESNGKRAFKAAFTDTVGQNITETFGYFIANKITQSNKFTPKKGEKVNNQESLEYPYVEANPLELPENETESSLKSIFRGEGDKVSLLQPKLKASSRNDFLKRLVCLFLAYKKILGMEKIPRSDLTTLLNHVSINDGNTRFTIGHETVYFRSKNNEVELLAPGEEFVRTILPEIFNPEVGDKWKLGTKGKTRKGKVKTDKE